jgi:FAD/FMN-containing dehydrogenase
VYNLHLRRLLTLEKSKLKEELVAIVGFENFSDNLADRLAYSRSGCAEEAGVPAYVVRPRSTKEIAEILKSANKYKNPAYVWGRGTIFAASGVQKGCILIDMTAMNRILGINEETMSVTTEAGTIWDALNTELKKRGWELTIPGPGSLNSCTVGGSIAASTIPHGLTGEGTTGDNLLNLEVVLPDGHIVKTGSAANPMGIPFERYCNGPDIAGFFIGSCGAFGVVTQATLRIQKVPEAEVFFCYGFHDLKNAFYAASELLQQRCARFLVACQGDLPVKAAVLMHIVTSGEKEEVMLKSKKIKSICEAGGGKELDNTGTRNYWKTHNVMYSWLRWKDPKIYYARKGIPYFCPEIFGFLPLLRLIDMSEAFWKYWNENDAVKKINALFKGFDVYFSRNGGYLWIDTLYSYLNKEAREVGFQVRRDLYDMLLDHGGAPATIGGGEIAERVMSRLTDYHYFLKGLKKAVDPNRILNPGVLDL